MCLSKCFNHTKPSSLRFRPFSRDSNNQIRGQIIVLVLAAEVVARFENDEGRNSPSARIDALGDYYPLPIAWLDLLWSSSQRRTCNDCSLAYLAHREACFIKVVRVVVLDAVLGFDVGYKTEPALYDPRILAEGSFVVVLAFSCTSSSG